MDANRSWPRWLREPVVHFVALGTAVFVGYAIWQEPQPTDPLTADDAPIAQLRSDWNARTGAPPGSAEEKRLKEEWLEEEVLFRRALELGLDEHDTIVRRRLVQRMRFLIEDTTPIPEPDDLQLRAWIDAHPERYAEAARFSLDHVFFSRSKRGASLSTDAQRAAATLKAAPDATVPGDPFPRGNHLDGDTRSAIARTFGAAFAERASALPVGDWHGPFESSYGLHVVRVTRRIEEAPPSFDAARDRARADWSYEERKRRNQEAVEAIIRRYAGEGSSRP
jgi:peptidyl-prolyl cis-trans isomerase C